MYYFWKNVRPPDAFSDPAVWVASVMIKIFHDLCYLFSYVNGILFLGKSVFFKCRATRNPVTIRYG